MKNKNLTLAAILGMLAIIFGAFGAHALKKKLGVEDLKTFETGVRYQIIHVLVLLLVNMYADFSQRVKNTISLFFFLGILFFQDHYMLLLFYK